MGIYIEYPIYRLRYEKKQIVSHIRISRWKHTTWGTKNPEGGFDHMHLVNYLLNLAIRMS